MKIKVRDALNLNSWLELEFDEFKQLSVDTVGISNSNMFLLSLWREFDNNITPKKNDRCPWAYLPQKLILKKSNVTYFGSFYSKFGYIHVAISFKTKGNIDNICFYSASIDLNTILPILKGFVKHAKQNINNKFVFRAKTEFRTNFKGVYLENYFGDKFGFSTIKKKTFLELEVSAIDKYHATNLLMLKIRLLIDFLSVETNIPFYHDKVIIEQKKLSNFNFQGIKYQSDFKVDNSDDSGDEFIDMHPIKADKIFLSREGVEFIEKYIINSDEYFDNDLISLFIKSCGHFRKGLYDEIGISGNLQEASNELFLYVRKNAIRNTQSIIDNSITYYLSALETASMFGHNPDTCPECNQIRYKINQRVSNFVKGYLTELHGSIFKKIYNFRSKYLHSGEYSTTNNDTIIKPMIDLSTGTGAIDAGFITLSLSNGVIGVDIQNIREWTSFCLRKYYKENIINYK
jgi:hypothetical protein